MKKKLQILLLGIFIFSGFSAYAGDDGPSKGVRAGWQYSNLIKDGNSLYKDHLNSFYVGIFGAKKLGGSKLLQLTSGLTYYQFGSVNDDDNKLKLHYLNLPVSVKVTIGPVFAFGGLSGAVKLGGEAYAIGERSDVKEFSNFDAGAFAGIGAKILIIGIEAKYTWGLVDVYNGFYTQNFQLGLQVYF